ncbi:TPA: hypothetical protein ACWMJN_003862 [Morganella morganii]
MTNTVSRRHVRTEDQILIARMENLLRQKIDDLEPLSADRKKNLVALPDDELWIQVYREAAVQKAINTPTPQKTEQEEYAENRMLFIRELNRYGGVHKSSVVTGILQLTTPTVHKKGEKGELIVLEWGNDKLYPAFQFSVDEKLSEKGMLKGVPLLLSHLTHPLSPVRKCNFFTRLTDLPGSGERISALAVLQRGATGDEMQHLITLADNFGTQNAM